MVALCASCSTLIYLLIAWQSQRGYVGCCTGVHGGLSVANIEFDTCFFFKQGNLLCFHSSWFKDLSQGRMNYDSSRIIGTWNGITTIESFRVSTYNPCLRFNQEISCRKDRTCMVLATEIGLLAISPKTSLSWLLVRCFHG